jgi:hypothetical protein
MDSNLQYNTTKLLLAILFSLLLGACKPTQFAVTLQPQSLKAIDLEETLTGADEVMLVYSLTAVNAQNQLIGTKNQVWGVEKITKNQVIGQEKLISVHLDVPAKGQIQANVILIEIEDYQKAQQLIDKLRKANGLATIPMMALEVGEAATPLRYVTLALSLVGESLKYANYIDTDDLLGEHQYLLDAERLKKNGFRLRIPVTFKDKHLAETYEYQLVYELTTQAKSSKHK